MKPCSGEKLDIELEQYTPEMDLVFMTTMVNDSQSISLPVSPHQIAFTLFRRHHKPLGTVAAHFTDIRENAGSTSAIATSIYKRLKLT